MPLAICDEIDYLVAACLSCFAISCWTMALSSLISLSCFLSWSSWRATVARSSVISYVEPGRTWDLPFGPNLKLTPALIMFSPLPKFVPTLNIVSSSGR